MHGQLEKTFYIADQWPDRSGRNDFIDIYMIAFKF